MSETENIKNRIIKQTGRILGFHLVGIFVILVIFYFMLFSMWTIKILEIILGFLALIVYGLIMAATAKGIADKDLLTGQKKGVFPAKGLVLACAVVILNLLIFAAVKVSWALNAPEGLKLTLQILFFILTLPYNFFLKISGGDISGIGLLLMILVPYVATGAGYYAGYKKWDIFEKLDKIAFEKKENK